MLNHLALAINLFFFVTDEYPILYETGSKPELSRSSTEKLFKLDFGMIAPLFEKWGDVSYYPTPGVPIN